MFAKKNLAKNYVCKKEFNKKKIFAKKNVLPPQPQPRIIGRFENQKNVIFFRNQAGLYGAHKNKVIHHILKLNFHIGNVP